MTGSPGLGKTTIIRNWVESLNQSANKVIYISLSTVTTQEFYRQLCNELGGEARYRKVDNFKEIQSAIRRYVIEKKMTPVIIFDEAQYMKSQILSDLKILFNFDMDYIQEPNLRRAISMSVDKNNFTDVLLSGNGTPAVGPFPSNLPFGDQTVRTVDFDLDGARQLLNDIGWLDSDGDGYLDRDGRTLELNYLTYTSRQELPLLAEMLQADLKKIGVKLYKAFLKRGDYDLFSKAIVTAPTGDPEYYFTSHVVSSAVDNAGHYNSPTISALEEELHNTYGADARAAIAIKMSQQVLDDCALIYASHLKMSFVMKNNVEGFAAHPSDYYEITPALDKT